jgi:Dof domain, zinc finger
LCSRPASFWFAPTLFLQHPTAILVLLAITICSWTRGMRLEASTTEGAAELRRASDAHSALRGRPPKRRAEEDVEADEVLPVGGIPCSGCGGQARAALGRKQQLLPPRADSVPRKCPRCSSINTKFCYYNNYDPHQPRHWCKVRCVRPGVLACECSRLGDLACSARSAPLTINNTCG